MTAPWLFLMIALASVAGAGMALTLHWISAAVRNECPSCGTRRVTVPPSGGSR